MFEPNRHRFCIAPMMGRTDRFCRYFMRRLSRRAMLYTEMVTTEALIFGPGSRILAHASEELPLALQLGGNHPTNLAKCAVMAQQTGFSEVNLNLGCPSSRASSGGFGACLMTDPELAAECVKAMTDCQLPVTVKCRTGVDQYDSDQYLIELTGKLREAGCALLIVHARKALLKGLSPKQNRTVPTLNYHRVYRLKQFFPELPIILNGGLNTLEQCQAAMANLDGVMVGRSAYENPAILNQVDRLFYGEDSGAVEDLDEVVDKVGNWLQQQHHEGVTSWSMIRHMLGLYKGQRGARQWRRFLSENSRHFPYAANELLQRAQQIVRH